MWFTIKHKRVLAESASVTTGYKLRSTGNEIISMYLSSFTLAKSTPHDLGHDNGDNDVHIMACSCVVPSKCVLL